VHGTADPSSLHLVFSACESKERFLVVLCVVIPKPLLPLGQDGFVGQVHGLGLLPHLLHPPLDQMLVLGLELGRLLLGDVELQREDSQLVLDVLYSPKKSSCQCSKGADRGQFQNSPYREELLLDPQLLVPVADLAHKHVPLRRQVADCPVAISRPGAQPLHLVLCGLKPRLQLPAGAQRLGQVEAQLGCDGGVCSGAAAR
jgi:hypothetical protein